jgi:hypothetical protein
MWKAQYSLSDRQAGLDRLLLGLPHFRRYSFQILALYLLHILIVFARFITFVLFIKGSGKKNHAGLYLGDRLYWAFHISEGTVFKP